MRFKKPQVRYADTPQPATPYQAAGQVWDDRIGSPRVQAKNWRLMAFGCLTLALLMAGGLVWRSAQSIVTPYVVEVDNAGQVRAVGEAATPYRPNDAQTAHHIARFVTLVRSLSIDPIVVRQNWLDAYDYTTDKGAAVLNDYARVNDPFARIGKESVTVQITSVVRASDTSFNVRWTERRYVNGAAAGWSGGRPWCPSCCSRRAPKNACARTPWASTSTACRGAANWILPKEPSHE
jgi:type IV secretory pathway TrbF-like protein